jgi:hypothetical protein
MTLAELQEDLLSRATTMGHVMTNFNQFLISECAICGLVCWVDEDPTSGLTVGGSALLCFCDTEQTFIRSTERG